MFWSSYTNPIQNQIVTGKLDEPPCPLRSVTREGTLFSNRQEPTMDYSNPGLPNFEAAGPQGQQHNLDRSAHRVERRKSKRGNEGMFINGSV